MVVNSTITHTTMLGIAWCWMMVRGSPRHSESNGGVKRVNQMVQKKLGGWMKTNKSNNWAIGCRMAMWRINTQVHQTTNDTPYHLTYGQHPRVGLTYPCLLLFYRIFQRKQNYKISTLR